MQTVREQLAEALERLLEAVDQEILFYPDDYSPKHARAALDRHRAAQARPDRESTCPDCGTECPCYQEGLEAQRERVGGGTA
jgi:hypothetical protein